MAPFKSLFIALLLYSVSVGAKEPLASNQAEQAFNMWLAAFNEGKRKSLQAFITKYKKAYDVQDDLDFRDSMGRFKVLSVKSSTPKKVEVLLLAEANDQTLLATMTINPNDRFDVDKFQFETVETPAEYKPKRSEIPALLAEGKARLDSLASSGKLSGTLLVARDGNVLLEWSGGFADRQDSVANDKETKFRLASLSKMFTGIAILQLAEAGKLSLDDTVAKHLKNYPNQPIASSITIRQLLNNTSGLGDIFGKEYDKHSQSLKTHADYWRVFSSQPLKFKPGSEDQYSNYGYILLGGIIEAACGQSYYDYVEQHIYRVAGMASTGSEPESTPVAGLAIAYTKVDGHWRQETASLPWRGTSAGGGYSTVGDLLKFAVALESGTIISRKSLEAATMPQNHKAWYGYGFMVSGNEAEKQYGHEGGAIGANAAFVVLPINGYVVVGLSNFDPSTMANMVNFFGHRLPL